MTLPTLEIRSEANAMTLKHMEVLINDHPLPGLRSLVLELKPDDVNRCYVELAVSSVTIDPQTYALLEAYVKEEKR